MKSDVNSFLYPPTGVPVRMSIVGVFSNDGGLGTGASYIPFEFFDPLLRGLPYFPDLCRARRESGLKDGANVLLF